MRKYRGNNTEILWRCYGNGAERLWEQCGQNAVQLQSRCGCYVGVHSWATIVPTLFRACSMQSKYVFCAEKAWERGQENWRLGELRDAYEQQASNNMLATTRIGLGQHFQISVSNFHFHFPFPVSVSSFHSTSISCFSICPYKIDLENGQQNQYCRLTQRNGQALADSCKRVNHFEVLLG